MKYINNVDFAQKGKILSGDTAISQLSRVNQVFEELNGKLYYTISGSMDKKNKPILTVGIYGKMSTLCQNCLKKLNIPINYSNIVPIFYTESDMDNALFGNDSTYTDGILADVHFNIDNFIEDELIMLLPIAPKHQKCSAVAYHDKPNSPFSVLVKQ